MSNTIDLSIKHKNACNKHICVTVPCSYSHALMCGIAADATAKLLFSHSRWTLAQWQPY